MKTLLLLVSVVACRSASSHYYTLVAPADDAPAPVSNELQVDVLPVDVPPDVDRAEIVVRERRLIDLGLDPFRQVAG